MNILLLDESELSADRLVTLRGRRSAHLLGVLGVEVGSELRAGIVRGPRGIARVERIDGDAVQVSFAAAEVAPTAPALELVLALPRPKVLSRCIASAAAFGTARISLINAWRVDKSYFGSPRVTEDSLLEDARLGCEQGGHTWIPQLRVFPRFMTFCDSLEPPSPASWRVVAHPGAGATMRRVPAGTQAVTVAIGPEGGWIERELDTLDGHGFERVSLSASILRSEAALVAALAQLELTSPAVFGAMRAR